LTKLLQELNLKLRKKVINLKKYTPFITYWAANSLVFYLANLYDSATFVIGSSWMGYTLNIIWVGLWLTLILFAVKVLGKKAKAKFPGRSKGLIYYWFWNFVIIWLIAKLAFITGFGIPKFYWAAILAIFTNLFQWLARQLLKKAKVF
jgi:hypothetical protein